MSALGSGGGTQRGNGVLGPRPGGYDDHVLDPEFGAASAALLIVDWSIEGTGSDGNGVDFEGTAADVARRGADGRWRYVIDNPFGTAGARGQESH